MGLLINDKVLMVDYCRDEKQSQVIHVILINKELKNYISHLLKKDENIDARDILHDTIISFIKIAMKRDFILEKPPLGYLKTIAKNLYYSELKRIKKSRISFDELKLKEGASPNESFDKKELVQELLSKIGEDCKGVLYMWAMKLRMVEIAEKMNYGSQSYAKKKKHICLKKLVAFIESQPKLSAELKNYV